MSDLALFMVIYLSLVLSAFTVDIVYVLIKNNIRSNRSNDEQEISQGKETV